MTNKKKTSKSLGKKARKKKDTDFEISYQSIAVVLGLFLIIAVVFILLDRIGGKSSVIDDSLDNTVKSDAIESGDIVLMNYILSFVNGTVFDTSYENIAIEAGIYTPERNYTALSFIVGNQSLIAGVDSAVVGMSIGQEKTVNLPHEEAYGPYDESQIRKMQRIYNLSRIDIVPLNDFEQTVGPYPRQNATYESPNVPWPMHIIEVTGDSVILDYIAEKGSTIATMLGNATVIDVTNSTITLMEEPVKGWGILTREGQFAKIIDYDNSTIFLDFNHPLAGKTLVFTIKIEGIQKGA